MPSVSVAIDGTNGMASPEGTRLMDSSSQKKKKKKKKKEKKKTNQPNSPFHEKKNSVN